MSRRLEEAPEDLVSRIADLALRAMDLEQRRETSLDTRSTALLGVLGLSFTLAFTFGTSALLQHRAAFLTLGAVPWRMLNGMYLIALLLGIFCGAHALAAFRIGPLPRPVRAWRLLDAELLSRSPGEVDDLSARYSRAVTARILQGAQELAANNDRRAAKVATGIRLFACFLALVGTIGGAVTLLKP
jgi:hypothetical protein